VGEAYSAVQYTPRRSEAYSAVQYNTAQYSNARGPRGRAILQSCMRTLKPGLSLRIQPWKHQGCARAWQRLQQELESKYSAVLASTTLSSEYPHLHSSLGVVEDSGLLDDAQQVGEARVQHAA
jgi:hypothetical protein